MYVNKIDRYNIVMSFVTQCYCLALLILYKYKRFYIVLHVQNLYFSCSFFLTSYSLQASTSVHEMQSNSTTILSCTISVFFFFECFCFLSFLFSTNSAFSLIVASILAGYNHRTVKYECSRPILQHVLASFQKQIQLGPKGGHYSQLPITSCPQYLFLYKGKILPIMRLIGGFRDFFDNSV